jgi:8-oxo-dGTP pyrophosphatase MutT (NUDIX family)
MRMSPPRLKLVDGNNVTDTTVPAGARAAARVLVLDGDDRLLLLEAADTPEGHRWWVAPGGGLQSGESFEAAAQRELYEETGFVLAIARWVWTRRHVFHSEGRHHDQYERYFVARTMQSAVTPVKGDSYVVGHRWWHLSEIEQSAEDFAPRRLAMLLPSLIRGEYPNPPIDCGV